MANKNERTPLLVLKRQQEKHARRMAQVILATILSAILLSAWLRGGL